MVGTVIFTVIAHVTPMVTAHALAMAMLSLFPTLILEL